ncbi:uncharacterized protein DUF1707 [Micromonospora pisi]|uniref:Uncharacterized protein DUF1707 n=2 Tax=Micromonospora pisi TaxID=589240 RepID=A0A495JMB4_9ACTN|nr:uncharacterized protein DUF1707 [Micromonospora pisi]
MRASDDDRQRVLDDLQRHTAAGRLDLDEFSERAAAVYAARTLADLAAVTRDLPATPTPSPVSESTTAAAAHGRRDLLLLFAVAVVTLVLLFVFMAVTRGPGWVTAP